jgi:acetaldehyde dehydrogenase (acetylating)
MLASRAEVAAFQGEFWMTVADKDLRSIQEARALAQRAKVAQAALAGFSQEAVDRIVDAMAKAVLPEAERLARLAHEETGFGNVKDKTLKNTFVSKNVHEYIKPIRTVGILREDKEKGIVEIAEPMGVVAAIVPSTNPTSTAIFKALVSIKARDAVVMTPHPSAKNCILEAVRVMHGPAVAAGLPPDALSCLSEVSLEGTQELMRHRDTGVILATGGIGLVRAAYSSGKPAYGVGPGNVPVYIDRSADVAWAAQAITSSQSFDNATLCCSEQGVVLDRPIAEPFLSEMQRRGAYLADERETELLGKLCNRRGGMNPDVVGIDPWRIAEKAGFSVPKTTTVLLAHQGGVGKEWPLSIEILAPLLSVHTVDGWREGCRTCIAMLEYGGLGHTLAIYAKDQAVLDAFFLEKPANRILVNGPASQGAVGYSTNLVPSMSLGCGPQAGNITSDNISARHLVNIKRVAFLKKDWSDIERKDHARAATLLGGQGSDDAAPRGSGLPGDPALGTSGSARSSPGTPSGRSTAATVEVRSNWQGNPAVVVPAERASGTAAISAASATPFPLRPKTAAKPKSAPTFTRPREPDSFDSGSARGETFGAGGAAVAAVIARPAANASTAQRTSPFVGSALSPSEIQTLMQHAGAGCPLGPCKGCPHFEIPTGACTA